MPAALPPYLTSGASSRSHHALLVKLHEAKSEQEEDQILRQEIMRQKELMAVKGQSTVCYTSRPDWMFDDPVVEMLGESDRPATYSDVTARHNN